MRGVPRERRAISKAPSGQPFEWLADADMRLGPVLEAYINGRYAWIPFARLGRIRIEAPEDLRDVGARKGGARRQQVGGRYPSRDYRSAYRARHGTGYVRHNPA